MPTNSWLPLSVHAGVLHLHNVWTAPLETLAIIALLLVRFGPAAPEDG